MGTSLDNAEGLTKKSTATVVRSIFAVCVRLKEEEGTPVLAHPQREVARS
jgi:hypothetical protein